MGFKKVLSGAIAAVMMTVVMCGSAFAATPADGSYTGEIHFLNANGSGNNSMCDPIFVHQADVELTADAAELKFYVAYPIPAFQDQGTDGTVKDVVFTVDGVEYKAESDITTKPEKTFDAAGGLFGINAGDVLPTQVLSVSLPRDAVDDLAAGTVKASAYVNVVMNSTQNFFVKVTDLEEVGASQGNTQDMQITADVAEVISVPEYTVTVPESIAMGTLSASADNTSAYDVNVTAKNLNGVLTVAAPDSGSLTSGGNGLPFANSFGSQTVTQDTEGAKLNGQLLVTAQNVAAAAAGNYTGTTTFTITYAAN